MALQNVAWVLTGRGLMDCLQYYDNCLLYLFCPVCYVQGYSKELNLMY
jgi:hypothetical protein